VPHRGDIGGGELTIASTRLGPAERAAALSALVGTEVQVLVVGGVVGAGVALDAVTRGLSVGLVEARDFGSGTSSRSSKLIHGGLRYLEQLQAVDVHSVGVAPQAQLDHVPA
jgi:FAD dependent oxidoreductase